MQYLIRDSKVEYSGNKQQIFEYIKEAYADDFFVQEYGKIFNKDYEKFLFTIEGLGLIISDKPIKRKKKGR